MSEAGDRLVACANDAAPGRPELASAIDQLYDPEKHRHGEIDWGKPVGTAVW